MNTQLTQKQKNRLRRIALVTQEGDVGIVKELNTLEDKIEALGELKGEKGDTPSDSELIALIKPLIPEPLKGDRGDTPTPEELLALIKPLIPEVKNGETPSDERLLALITPLIPEAKQGSPDTPSQIVEKLESLSGDERLDKKAVKGLDEEIDRLDKRINEKSSGGGGKQLMAVPFSFNGDGATTQFYLPTEPLGKGWFLFAHYQGQWLQKEIHFALNRKIFDTSAGSSPFTPENGTVIEGFIIF